MSTTKTFIINNHRANIDAFIQIECDDEGLVQKAIDTINSRLEDIEEIAIEDPAKWNQERRDNFIKYGDSFEKRSMVKYGFFTAEELGITN